jgi:hypothetical protein
MSESQKTATPTVAPTAEIEASVEKKNLIAKTKQFVKEHKKATIAVVGLTALVVAASITGKKVPSIPNVHVEADFEAPPVGVDVSTDNDADA